MNFGRINEPGRQAGTGWPLPGSPRGLHLTLLGGFDLRCDGEVVALPMSAQRVLAFLALQDGAVQRGLVAGTLWPDSSEDRASANLRSVLWRLHRPGYELVRASATHLALSPAIGVDVQRSAALARRLLDWSVELGEIDPYEVSLADDVLPGWYDDWVLLARERHRQLRLHALESLCERLAATGRFGQAVEAGLAAVSGEPLRESAHRTLIKAYLAEGNRGEAIKQYRQYRQLLNDELGVPPSPQMEDLVGVLTVR